MDALPSPSPSRRSQRGFASTNYSKLATRHLRRDLPGGYHVAATGLQELANNPGSKGFGIVAETMLGGLGGLAAPAFVFASFFAVIPLA